MDISANDKRLRSPYNAEESIEGLIERLNNCDDFSAAVRELFTETQLVCIIY